MTPSQPLFTLNRRSLLGSAVAALGAATLPAQAQSATKIVFGYTAVSDFVTVFVASQEGYFSKRGLDVEPKFIPLNPSIPAAIQSDSLQMGGPTPSVHLQAVDAGLDQVVVAGGNVGSKSNTNLAFVARSGSGIKTAQDCIGKKIGVPGLGAFLHVTFRAWLKNSGVDYTKVTFVEASFPQHSDLLRGGSVDGVVTADPFMSRILAANTGYVASYYSTFLTEGMPSILFTARRDWAQKNPQAVKAFREAVVEAAAFVNNPKNDKKVREHIGKFIKLPPEVLATMQVGTPGPRISEKQLVYWRDMMREQNMLKTDIKLSQQLV
ncbi:ABC transporter substrate-binding protein [Polaromonas sp. SM01]|uniref:ABC transporter substrate-binding protein n=1 Tax=Polaromonas sp. SM01 TaxID=3085630 RepID=UPI002980E751|nr:ABC transporter substrate-binding protein [Polaromonas sp. SM01]MDW5441340.1 ABC transporter substrate-binding protein [Polaromonas sp. SM01]